MVLLLLAFLAGVAIRFLIMWAFGKFFTIKGQVAQIIVAVVIGVGLSWLMNQINLSGWLGYVVMATLGFLSKYGIEWLNDKVG